MNSIDQIARAVEHSLPARIDGAIVIDGGQLEAIDTGSALSLVRKIPLELRPHLQFTQLKPVHRDIFRLVLEMPPPPVTTEQTRRWKFIEQIGVGTISFFENLLATVAFLGQALSELTALIFRPSRFRVREFVVQLEIALHNAIPVISLVTLLIGVVLAYLFAGQMQKYGANIFVVDSVALAMSRELSPLIVATVVAGRSGSAYTAQIGSMKLTREIDALEVMGLRTFDVLILPRIVALMVAMPILVFIGDVVGIFGGAVIADSLLDISPVTFLERLKLFKLKHYYSGFYKAPVFALFIALIGCRMGLSAETNARSVGLNTTSTVVQSIVAVILLDAAFAILYMELGY